MLLCLHSVLMFYTLCYHLLVLGMILEQFFKSFSKILNFLKTIKTKWKIWNLYRVEYYGTQEPAPEKNRCNTMSYDACWHLGRFLILLSLPDKNVYCFHCSKVSFCLWDSTAKKQMVLEEIRFILIQAKAFFFFF